MLIIFLLTNKTSYTQVKELDKIKTFFKKKNIEYNQLDLIENVLMIKNLTDTFLKVKIEILVPEDWKVLKNKKIYTIEPLDSLGIPIYVLPRGKFEGSTRFLIFCNVLNEEGSILSSDFFTCSVKKRINWKLVTTSPKLYFPIDSTKILFNVTIFNESDFEQEIMLNLKYNKRKGLIKDSNNIKIITEPIVFSLKRYKDTTIHFTYNKLIEPRNFRYVDKDEYIPYSLGLPRKDIISIISQSPHPTEADKFRSGKKIEIISLNDHLVANKFTINKIPLILETTTYNLFFEQPLTNVSLRGETFLPDSSLLIYFTQFYLYTNYFNYKIFKNIPFYIGYFHKKFNIQVGDVGGFSYFSTGNLGKGIRGEYYFKPNHKIGLFYNGYPNILKIMPQNYSFGINHFIDLKAIRLNTNLGYNDNNIKNTRTYLGTSNITLRIIKGHTFGITSGLSYQQNKITHQSSIGYLYGINYGGTIIPEIWRLNLNYNYTSSKFGYYSGKRIFANAGNSFTIKNKLILNIINRYNKYEIHSTNNFYEILENLLSIGYFKFINPALFFNYYNILNLRYYSYGINASTSYYNYNNLNYEIENLRIFHNLKTGFNYLLDTLYKHYFFIQNNIYFIYKTFTFNLSHTLGALNLNDYMLKIVTRTVPQYFKVFTRYQYQFKNPRFIYEQKLGYTYNNILTQMIHFTPELYYYTRTYWRFYVFSELTLSKRKINWLLYDYQNTIQMLEIQNKIKEKWNRYINVGFGVRKEFGIPIPTKVKVVNAYFYAFYDLNGNKKRDINEPYVSNLVIRINEHEVITNNNGRAVIENLLSGTYKVIAFSCINNNEWFPFIPDSISLDKSCEIPIPLVRGIKVCGKVFIQRDPMSPTADIKIDVSGIKISALNGRIYSTLTQKDGSFELYLPAGKYTISLDESIIGERFYLVKNNFEVNVKEGFDNIFITFYIVEKKRKVRVIKFENGSKNE